MKMTKVRLIGLDQVDLPIIGAKLSDPYICKAIDGLGPTDITVRMSENAVAGSSYQGRRPLNREVVVRIALNPNYILGEAPTDLRQALYGLITPDSPGGDVDIQLMDGNTVVAVTSGWVKKFETVLFSKEPEVQITFTCSEPYLRGPAPVSVPTPIDEANVVVVNEGTAPTGFEIVVEVTTDVSFVRMLLANKEMLIEPVGTSPSYIDPIGIPDWFLVGDILTINSEIGSKSISIQRGVDTYNGLYMTNGGWLELQGGQNLIDLIPDANLAVNSITYTPKYWGI